MIIFAGSLFTVAFIFFVGLLCGGVAWFIDSPSFLVIVLPLIFFLCATKSGKAIGGYIKSSLKRNHEYGASELEIIAASAKNMVKFTLASGWLGFFSGLIAMLASIDNPALIGPNLAVSFITLFYSFAISYLVFFPVQAWAENKAKLIKHK